MGTRIRNHWTPSWAENGAFIVSGRMKERFPAMERCFKTCCWDTDAESNQIWEFRFGLDVQQRWEAETNAKGSYQAQRFHWDCSCYTFRRSWAFSAHLYTMSRTSAMIPPPYTLLAAVLGDKNLAKNFSSVSQVIPRRMRQKSGAMQEPNKSCYIQSDWADQALLTPKNLVSF